MTFYLKGMAFDLSDKSDKQIDEWIKKDHVPKKIWKKLISDDNGIEGYTNIMIKAIRSGLDTHPLVKKWINNKKCLGDRDFLRKVRLEKGIKPPFKKVEAELRNEIMDLIEDGKGYEDIREKLIKENKVPVNLSSKFDAPQSFHRLLSELEIHNYYIEIEIENRITKEKKALKLKVKNYPTRQSKNK